MADRPVSPSLEEAMRAARDVLPSDNIPPSLFHYTTADGLLGILMTSRIWATELRFLNDAQEVIYAQDELASRLRVVENPAIDATHIAHSDAARFGEVFDRYREYVLSELGSPRFPVYVACFCESGDQLSQWRGYGSDHGYAIEVDAADLRSAAQECGGTVGGLVRVRYGPDAASEVIEAAVQKVREDTNLGHVGVHAHYMALRLTTMLAGVKHPGFSEEREWRLIIGSEMIDSKIMLRTSLVAVVPYVEINLPSTTIRSVRVGPGRNTDVRVRGVERLLERVGSKVQVLSSELPLRV